MNKASLLMNFELLIKRSEELFKEASLRNYLSTISVKKKRVLLKKLARNAEGLLNDLKIIEYGFLYHSFDNSVITKQKNTLQRKLQNIMSYSRLRVPTFIVFLLVKYQVWSFQATLSKVIDYTESEIKEVTNIE